MSWLSSIGIDLCRPSSGGGGTPTPTPTSDPITSNLASGWTTGDNPPAWDTAYSGVYYNADTLDAGYGEGDQLRLRYRRTVGGAWTTLAWTPFDAFLLLPAPDGGFQSVYTFLTDGTLALGGFFEVQVQAVHNLGLTGEAFSSWSNSWSDTLNASAESASSFATVNGQDKKSDATVDGTGNLTVSSYAGASNSVRAARVNNARLHKRQWQVVVNTRADNSIWMAVDDGTRNLGSSFGIAGLSDSTGVCLSYYDTTYWTIYVGGVAVQSHSSGPETAMAPGDALTCAFDTDAGTVSFYVTLSGVTTQVGTTITSGFPSGALKASVGLDGGPSVTAKFGSGQIRTLDSGYVPYDN